MDLLVGHKACASFPGNETSTDNPYATKPAGGTATTAVPAPTNLAPDVNTECGKYYQVKEGDYCQVMAMTNGIMLDDFYFLNPGIDKNCTNLWLNYNYCVSPVGNIEIYPGYATVTGGAATSRWMPAAPTTVIDWDDLSPATPKPWTSLPMPTTLPLGNGDTCDGVLQKANIALGALYAWNPSVKDDCSNLWLNTSYCLYGDGYEGTFYPYPLPSEPFTTSDPPTPTSTCGVDAIDPPGPT
ncbi:hypothetical protein BJX99DRAFT_262045 [Aspergillus californicus]